eukprot:732855-Rhodomonas_salina.1
MAGRTLKRAKYPEVPRVPHYSSLCTPCAPSHCGLRIRVSSTIRHVSTGRRLGPYAISYGSPVPCESLVGAYHRPVPVMAERTRRQIAPYPGSVPHIA